MKKVGESTCNQQLIDFIQNRNNIKPLDCAFVIRNNVTPKIAVLQKKDLEKTVTVVQKVILDCIEIYYGIGSKTVSNALIEEFTVELLKRYSNLRIEDIKHSFKRYNIQRDNNWRNITIQQLMKPIEDWNNYKIKLSNDYIRETKKHEKDALIKLENEKFTELSKVKFNHHVKNGFLEWSGTIYEASSICSILCKNLSEEEKQLAKNKARKDYLDREEAKQMQKKYGKPNPFINELGMSEERIYAMNILELSLLNGKKI